MISLCGAATLAVAACGSSAAGPPSTLPISRGTPSAAPVTSSALPNASPSAAPTTPSASPVSTDTAACAAGRCEVRVSPPETITLEPALELTMLRVVSIKNGVVTIVTTSTFNGGDAGVSSNANVCSSNGTNATTTNDMEVGCTITNNELSMSVVSVDGDSAVLHLEPVS